MSSVDSELLVRLKWDTLYIGALNHFVKFRTVNSNFFAEGQTFRTPVYFVLKLLVHLKYIYSN